MPKDEVIPFKPKQDQLQDKNLTILNEKTALLEKEKAKKTPEEKKDFITNLKRSLAINKWKKANKLGKFGKNKTI